MSFVETDFWTIEIPDEWEAAFEDDVVSIIDPDDIGSLEISAVKKSDSDVDDADLKAFASDLMDAGAIPELVEVAGLSGIYFDFIEDELCWREWYLRSGDLALIASYNVEPENKGLDDVVIDQILDTLTINEAGGVDADDTGSDESDSDHRDPSK